MKTTNYTAIAEKYDKNQYRVGEVKVDQDLQAYIEKNKDQTEIHVLDLSCGTGLYLEKQTTFFKENKMKWYGLDLSEAMLKKAKEKVDHVEYTHGDAENMPFSSGKFDFISNNYAFHHYKNKEKALNEMDRVLKKGGIYKMHNIAIHDMTKLWMYHYFPSTYHEDLKRFWQKDVIFNELTQRGFQVEINIDYKMEQIHVKDILNFAENRDISALTLIRDEEYQEGVEKMRFDLKNDPNKTIVNDFADMFCLARKV
ncbi:class I SAM-dependent methyltransferase [Bacillus carboniphilus]|uniref:Class I SAM-dependent methyltransferase n=1 Tax=Bacillus carboniphilus TaxID=86663 RepID=A0ABY9JS94_9BACI|nr:class I SAM-dependent methyltransferase [Bacillus carboniphilus]WLR42280.1 class I SAM-dependent methyltransferase [Bacillus carboniphilus]